MPQAGIDTLAQSHASNEASALPPNHHGRMYVCFISAKFATSVLYSLAGGKTFDITQYLLRAHSIVLFIAILFPFSFPKLGYIDF